MRLDEEKLEALRSWGERLRQSAGEESAAVGRAILMLIEEIDQLHIELWHARLRESHAEPVPTDSTEEVGKDTVATGLHTRLRRFLRSDSGSADPQPVEPDGSDTEPDSTTSPQAWLDALRRQQ